MKKNNTCRQVNAENFREKSVSETKCRSKCRLSVPQVHRRWCKARQTLSAFVEKPSKSRGTKEAEEMERNCQDRTIKRSDNRNYCDFGHQAQDDRPMLNADGWLLKCLQC
jgi:hypothetical protein